MTFLWGFDFGETTGISLATYTDTEAYALRACWEVHNGLDGFVEWYEQFGGIGRADKVVAEKFVARSGQDFVPDLVGVPLEGALAALWRGEINWQTPDRKGKAGLLDSILRAHGLWQEPPVDHEDSRDANDAIIHSLVYLRDSNHFPTLRKYFRNEVSK